MLAVVETTLLFDYYGSLLTKRTQEIMRLYYSEDWSLAEIADNLKVSRQSVHNALKRGLENLSAYEKELQLLEKQEQRRLLLADLNQLLTDSRVTSESKVAEAGVLLEKLAAVDNIALDGAGSTGRSVDC